ncbi:TatD family hydrolase [Serpentinimonas barnesii]|uniref:TatD family hydrolase n=1 Tax=Serpentinimonas barnesii TaxID=1458427 RepID=UPI0004975324|nr:TatD family hydrolase [Serpentinimonas barnesii]
MYIDSHCHLDFEELRSQLPALLSAMRQAQVGGALCISTTLETFPAVLDLAQQHPQLWATVGVHPDNEGVREPSMPDLLAAAQHPRVVGIGETGLDYYRLGERTVADMEWQRQRFRVHIRAARQSGLPLIIHTRSAATDTLAILQEEGGFTPGADPTPHLPAARGVFHCFTESAELAQAVLELGFYISFSGIITFRNAADLREVVRQVPLERCLIETDSPYLAPAPHRGKLNTPAYVPFVAQQLASVKGLTPEQVAQATTANFARLFSKARLPAEGLLAA